MIQKGFQHDHFVRAANAIKKTGVPVSRQSYRYDLLLNGEKYPPKYIISIAHKFLNGTEFPSTEFNAVEAKDYFIRRGYRIYDRKTGVKKSKIANEAEESKFPKVKKNSSYIDRLSEIQALAKRLRNLGWTRSVNSGVTFASFPFRILTANMALDLLKPIILRRSPN